MQIKLKIMYFYLPNYLSVIAPFLVKIWRIEVRHQSMINKKGYFVFAPYVFLTHSLVLSMSSRNRFSSASVRLGALGSSAGVA